MAGTSVPIEAGAGWISSTDCMLRRPWRRNPATWDEADTVPEGEAARSTRSGKRARAGRSEVRAENAIAECVSEGLAEEVGCQLEGLLISGKERELKDERLHVPAYKRNS